MVLIIHDLSERTLRFEKGDKIIWRGSAHDFTDDIAIQILKEYGKTNIINICNVRLWRLYHLYNMFIEKNESKLNFDNGIATDFKNKIKYILVLDMENIKLDNNYYCILLLYTTGLSKTLENRIIKSDLTFHFIST